VFSENVSVSTGGVSDGIRLYQTQGEQSGLSAALGPLQRARTKRLVDERSIDKS